MGRHRNETTSEAFMNVYRRGGVSGFWAGLGECAPDILPINAFD